MTTRLVCFNSFVSQPGAGTAYVSAKGATALISQLTDWLGPIGWVVAGVVAGLATGL